MPEFILDSDGEVEGKAFEDLDPFTRGYIEAAFFTECASGIYMVDWAKPENQEAVEEGYADGCVPSDAGFGDLYPKSLAAIIADCAKFQKDAADLLAQAYARDYDEVQAGRDYWFTRNGHGVGYWDRKELDADGLGDKLSEACEYTEVNLTFGDAADGSESPTGYGWVFHE